MKKIVLLLLVMLMSSCSSYINKMHKDLDRQTNRPPPKAKQPGTFDQFRNRQSNLSQLQKDRLSTSQRKNLPLSIKRKYLPENQVKRRYTAKDLTDSQNDSSLWSGTGIDNSLFVNSRDKKAGDILLINVQSKLKNSITLELKRAFPDRPKKKKKGEKPKEGEAKADAKPVAEAKPKEEDKEENENSDKVHDRISGILIEEISQDHVLIRGRKYLLYKNRKRLIEVQALVARRDIRNDDSVNSSKILEQSINVLR